MLNKNFHIVSLSSLKAWTIFKRSKGSIHAWWNNKPNQTAALKSWAIVYNLGQMHFFKNMVSLSTCTSPKGFTWIPSTRARVECNLVIDYIQGIPLIKHYFLVSYFLDCPWRILSMTVIICAAFLVAYHTQMYKHLIMLKFVYKFLYLNHALLE